MQEAKKRKVSPDSPNSWSISASPMYRVLQRGLKPTQLKPPMIICTSSTHFQTAFFLAPWIRALPLFFDNSAKSAASLKMTALGPWIKRQTFAAGPHRSITHRTSNEISSMPWLTSFNAAAKCFRHFAPISGPAKNIPTVIVF